MAVTAWKESEKFLGKDKLIGPLIKKYGHCTIRPSSNKDYFPVLVEAIVSQQVSGKAAEAINNRLRGGLGGINPQNLSKASPAKLRRLGLSRQKIGYLKNLARKVESSELKIRSLDDLSDEEVTKELVAVKGIGVWTAKMFLIFSLARPDVFPVEDLGIRNGIMKLLKKSFKPHKLEQIALRWKPYRTVASWYIWRSLENR